MWKIDNVNFPTGPQFEAMLVETIRKGIETKMSHVVCPVHQQSPRVVAKGTSLEDPELGLELCCEKLADMATVAFQAATLGPNDNAL